MFDEIIGNSQVKKYFKNMVDKGSIGNSLLFSGPEGIGKSLFANELGAMIVCQDDPHGTHRQKIATGNHPDIRHYRPEGKTGMHSIESMRHFNSEVYLAPFESKWKVFIIHDAHRMLTYSANALLKTFEEPAANTVIILLTNQQELLLPTVLSRCRTIHFQSIPEQDITTFLMEKQGLDIDAARKYAGMARGSIGSAVKLLSNEREGLGVQMLSLLSKGKVASYMELLKFVKDIDDQVEQIRKALEKSVKEGLLQGVELADIPAQQRHNLEKEIEGALSMKVTSEAQAIFDAIISWFRDLQLLYVGGNHQLLMNKEYLREMTKINMDGEPLPIEKAQTAVADAKLALSRSTSFSICLENLLFKLNLI